VSENVNITIQNGHVFESNLPNPSSRLRSAGHGMQADEATSLLTRRQWREGDVALLEAAAARLRSL
jgi:hypothetical protein